MRRHRYMVVEHSVEAEKIHEGKQFHEFVLPIHTMLGTYHWARLDDTHVFVTGYYESSNHQGIEAHPKVSLLPMMGSSKKMNKHLKAQHFLALATKLKLDVNATASDVAEAAESQFGNVFAADK